ncbi:MAG: succinylglutamate desuccinylase/aspartoacylase family protein [bacterium]|nr:succinylglutamate desuccinylase/aspartoacylase family protein [bacterium]
MVEGIYTVSGDLPGKTVTVMGGVHGDEPCGIVAIKSLISTFKPQQGKIHFIIANLRAIEQNKRETEMNLNRAFRPSELLNPGQENSYERLRALELMPYLDESEALLDIHSSMTVGSIPFIICEPHSFDIASRLPFTIISNGWDVIHPGGTDYYINKKGGKGICIECGYHLDEIAPTIAKNSILIFLDLMGLTNGAMPDQTLGQKKIYAHYVYHSKESFRLAKKFGDFEEISQVTLIGTDDNTQVVAHEDGVVIFARERPGPDEAFVLARII